MGLPDSVTKNYMSSPDTFADIFNLFLYGGEQRIDAEQLRPIDTTEIALPYGGNAASAPEQKVRDILKTLVAKTDGNVAYCLLGIENQTKVHYAMAVKNCLYDAINLAHQVSEAAKSHKQSGGNPTSEEYLSGFWKDDELIPIVTLTIFWGAGSWDGKLCLREMYRKVDPIILEHTLDYKVNLIAPNNLSEENLDALHTELREILRYIKHSGNAQDLLETVMGNEAFASMSRRAVEVINATTNSKLPLPRGEEMVNVCKAIEDIKKEEREEGRRDSTIEHTRKLMESQHWSAEEAMKAMGIPQSDFAEYLPLLQ